MKNNLLIYRKHLSPLKSVPGRYVICRDVLCCSCWSAGGVDIASATSHTFPSHLTRRVRHAYDMSILDLLHHTLGTHQRTKWHSQIDGRKRQPHTPSHSGPWFAKIFLERDFQASIIRRREYSKVACIYVPSTEVLTHSTVCILHCYMRLYHLGGICQHQPHPHRRMTSVPRVG